MNRLLIVSPHFPPTNAADMQRVRLLLPYLKNVGFDVDVLAVAPDCVAAPYDAWLESTLPAGIPIHRQKVMGLRWSKIPGLGTLTNRARAGLYQAGKKLLTKNQYDLVYFSTTQFGLHELGPRWKRELGVPFAMDYQDPWVNDYYQNNPHVKPPGGRLKYSVSSWLSRRSEPRVLRLCSGATSVSQAYIDALRERYDFLDANWPTLVAPFPADHRDLEAVKANDAIKQAIFDPSDDLKHWVYVGRGGQDMHRSVRAIFQAVAEYRQQSPGAINSVRMHFIGTSYASVGQGIKSIAPLAEEFGISDLVNELTDRIPYSQTLRCLLDADALIVPGSDDPGYTASKIYPYLMAKKPMLAVFSTHSSVTQTIMTLGGAEVVTFDNNTSQRELVERVRKSWLQDNRYALTCPLVNDQLQVHHAMTQATQLEAFFQKCLLREGATCELR